MSQPRAPQPGVLDATAVVTTSVTAPAGDYAVLISFADHRSAWPIKFKLSDDDDWIQVPGLGDFYNGPTVELVGYSDENISVDVGRPPVHPAYPNLGNWLDERTWYEGIRYITRSRHDTVIENTDERIKYSGQFLGHDPMGGMVDNSVASLNGGRAELRITGSTFAAVGIMRMLYGSKLTRVEIIGHDSKPASCYTSRTSISNEEIFIAADLDPKETYTVVFDAPLSTEGVGYLDYFYTDGKAVE